MPSDIPDYLEGWEDTFEISKYFGNDTIMTQLHNRIVTDSVKHQISQEVPTMYIILYIHIIMYI